MRSENVGSVSRFLGGLGACGASYPNVWLTDERANLTKDLLYEGSDSVPHGT